MVKKKSAKLLCYLETDKIINTQYVQGKYFPVIFPNRIHDYY